MKNKFMNRSYFVKAHIHQGYSFKCLMKYLSVFNVRGELTFYEHGIVYDRPCDLLSDLSGDGVGNIVNKLIIKAENILEYEWIDSPYCDYDYRGVKCYKVGLHLGPIDTDIKGVGKSGALDITVMTSKTPGSKYDILFSTRNNNLVTYTSVDSIHEFNTCIPINVPDHTPFAKVECKSFITTAPKKLMKSAHIVMSVYERGLKYSFIQTDGKVGLSGQTGGDKGKWITNYAISAMYIPAFKSLSQFSPGGLMRFYYEPSIPLKITFNIGMIGEASMYIAAESVEYAEHSDVGSYEASDDEDDDDDDE